jgi:opacity protein-like surface antigen
MIGIPAAAEENIRGWYEVGATVIQDAKLEAFFDQPLSDNKVKFDPGFRAAIALGTDLMPFLAVEAEGAFHYNSIKSVSGATSGLGDLYQFPVMGNVVLQFPNRTRLVPVLGGGVGAVFSVFDAKDITLGTARFSSSEETWTFAYQGYAGLLYQFRPEMALGVTYHYVNNDGPSWRDSAGNNVKFNRLVSHSLSLTFNFRF